MLLVRHGEPDYSELDRTGWFGPARDLAPMTVRGVTQAHQVGRSLASGGAAVLVSSPMTRALQTAAIISHHTGLALGAVEWRLREWLPDTTLSWRSFDQVQMASASYHQHDGEWPAGQTCTWEPRSDLRARAVAAPGPADHYQLVALAMFLAATGPSKETIGYGQVNLVLFVVTARAVARCGPSGPSGLVVGA